MAVGNEDSWSARILLARGSSYHFDRRLPNYSSRENFASSSFCSRTTTRRLIPTLAMDSGNPLPPPRVLVQDSKSISADEANAAVEEFLANFAARSTAENKNNSITHQLQNLSASLTDEARRASKKVRT